jgi:hypothetical protein
MMAAASTLAARNCQSLSRVSATDPMDVRSDPGRSLDSGKHSPRVER